MGNQSLVQGILVDKEAIEPGQVTQRFAFFNEDGTPIGNFNASNNNAQYNGSTITALAEPPVGGNNLPIDELGSGAALLDMTDPLFPTVVKDGSYAITAVVYIDSPIVDGNYVDITLHLDRGAMDFVARATATKSGTVGVSVGEVTKVSLSCTAYIPIGGIVNIDLSVDADQDAHLEEMGIQLIT